MNLIFILVDGGIKRKKDRKLLQPCATPISAMFVLFLVDTSINRLNIIDWFKKIASLTNFKIFINIYIVMHEINICTWNVACRLRIDKSCKY